MLISQIFRIENLTMAINYGLDRVRFPAPVPTGSQIRAGATLTEIRQTHLGLLSHARVTVEIDGQDKAACVADSISLFVG
ncbi:MAG: hypothetical protein ACLPN6_21575 [Streptosporangiaceae bacterium]